MLRVKVLRHFGVSKPSNGTTSHRCDMGGSRQVTSAPAASMWKDRKPLAGPISITERPAKSTSPKYWAVAGRRSQSPLTSSPSARLYE